MISYRFVPISSQKGVLFFETPGRNRRARKKLQIWTNTVNEVPAVKDYLFSECNEANRLHEFNFSRVASRTAC